MNPSPPSYAFTSIAYPTTLYSPTITVFSHYPIRKKVRSVFTVTVLPSISGILSGVTITPSTSSDIALSACSAFFYESGSTTAAAYPCSIVSNKLYVTMASAPLAATKTLTVRIVGKPSSTAGTTIGFKVEYYSSYVSTTDYTKRGEMTFTLTNSASVAIDSDSTIPFFKMGHFAPKIYTSAITAYAPFRIRFYHAGDMVTGFSAVNVYLKTTN